MSAIETLLDHVVDYAGLFPPAALSMRDAAHNYAIYRASRERWMLGRFVLPSTRLGELAAVLAEPMPNDEHRGPWPLSVLVDRTNDVTLRAPTGTYVAAIETRARDVSELDALGTGADRIGVPLDQVFVEVPTEGDFDAFAGAACDAGVALKLRTGGVTPDAFPAADVVLRFMDACIARGTPFKLTAGLHHPLRGEHPLTYEPGCPRGTMHGFLNVLAASALLAAGHGVSRVVPLLEERDARALRFDDETLTWRGHAACLTDLTVERRRLVSFGSCSFAEPVADLRALGVLGDHVAAAMAAE